MEHQTLKRIRDFFILFFAGSFLLFAQSTYWLNHTIFDQQTFTSTITPIIQSESSRSAIASTIVNQAFQDNPLLMRLIGKNVTQLVTGLLGTDLAQQLTSTVIDKTYAYLTTQDPKPIQIDLVAIKTPLEQLTAILESSGNDVKFDVSSVPDTIVLFDPSDLPDIYGYSILVLWLGPLFWIGSVFLFALYIYLGRKKINKSVYMTGGVILFVSCLGLLVGPLLPPPIVAQVPIPELRGVVDQIIAALLAPFTHQMVVTIIITVIVLLVFFFRFAIVKGFRWIVDKISSKMTQPNKPAQPEKVQVAAEASPAPVKTTKATKASKTTKTPKKKTTSKKATKQ